MAKRSRKYERYPKYWTSLVEVMEGRDRFEVPLPEGSSLESWRQEWYSFLAALEESCQDESRGALDRRQLRGLYQSACQIRCRKYPDERKLVFEKKGTTEAEQEVVQAISEARARGEVESDEGS